ncbi:MAG: hypothetical protein K2Y22_07945 [Candidatus Obscuribacterales bacterium]|nr:hypothetical protein [Candidatus Obscuribacterales bacterium]
MILCAALRQSWANCDSPGVLVSVRQLYELFPDLMPTITEESNNRIGDYYQLLSVTPDKTNQQIVSSYMRRARKKLIASRKQGKAPPEKEEYWRLLDAGFVLRMARLRLSHDLMGAYQWLVSEGVLKGDGTWDLTDSFKKSQQSTQTLPKIDIVIPEPKPVQDKQKLPRIIELLQISQIIGTEEVRAMEAQMALAPEVSVERLVLDSGYVTRQEMNSLKLAEMLLDEGKINIAQFQVAMYDERASGIRMAESLQARGWLAIDVTPQGQ